MPLITIVPVNDPPVARWDDVRMDPGGTLVVDVLANDEDAEGGLDPDSVTLLSAPEDGTAVLGPAGKLTYTSHGHRTDTDTVWYRVADVDGAWSAPALVIFRFEDGPQWPSP